MGSRESYAVRITLPTELIKPWLDEIQPFTEGIVAYEHNDDPQNIHTHIFILQAKVTKERLKQLATASHFTGKGNQFWSWKKADASWLIYLTYMSKGKLDPAYIYGGITLELCLTQKSKWVQTASKVSPGAKQYLEFAERVDQLVKVPGQEGRSYSDVVQWAKIHCRRKFGYYSQTCNAQIVNYAYTYCEDNKISIPKTKYKFSP